MNYPKTIIIVGTTSSGKSDLAVKIARKFNGEIISADSRQVYKRLDLGTGKITKKEMNGVPHHLLDVCSYKKVFTAYDFVSNAKRTIKEIHSRNKVAIVAGGTGFYIDALFGNISLANVKRNLKLRTKLEKKSCENLFSILERKDSKRASDIKIKGEVKNKMRLIRAIEVAYAPRTKRSLRHCADYISNPLWIGISLPKEELRKKINSRLIGRIKNGLLGEASKLYKNGLSYKRMESLGLEYRYLAQFMKKEITKEQMIAGLSSAIWKYAKRQKTYWRRNKEIFWFDAREYEKIFEKIEEFQTN